MRILCHRSTRHWCIHPTFCSRFTVNALPMMFLRSQRTSSRNWSLLRLQLLPPDTTTHPTHVTSNLAPRKKKIQQFSSRDLADLSRLAFLLLARLSVNEKLKTASETTKKFARSFLKTQPGQTESRRLKQWIEKCKYCDRTVRSPETIFIGL